MFALLWTSWNRIILVLKICKKAAGQKSASVIEYGRTIWKKKIMRFGCTQTF